MCRPAPSQHLTGNPRRHELTGRCFSKDHARSTGAKGVSHLNRLRDCAALVSFLWMCSAASGQISPLLVIEPWEPESQWADTVDELLFINGGHDKRSGTDIDIFFWDSSGRIKFDRKDADPRFWLGYRILTIDVDAPGVSAIHGELNDVAVVGALRLGESGDWAWTAMAGAGTANDGHFSNDDAIYGIGNLDAARAIDGRSAFHIGVNYDGNRGLLPDVPLPYVAYRYDSDDLSLTLGVLSSSVEWRPIEPITLTVQYSMPENAHAGLAWSLSDNVSLFTEYRRTLDGFYIDGSGGHAGDLGAVGRCSRGGGIRVRPGVCHGF
jgi:hypothetical protein